MENGSVGKPKGHKHYPEHIFTDQLTGEYQTTLEIKKKIDQQGYRLSWATVDKYLKDLVQNQVVDYAQIGNSNVYKLKK